MRAIRPNAGRMRRMASARSGCSRASCSQSTDWPLRIRSASSAAHSTRSASSGAGSSGLSSTGTLDQVGPIPVVAALDQEVARFKVERDTLSRSERRHWFAGLLMDKGHTFAERKATLVRGPPYGNGRTFAERKATLVRGSTYGNGHPFAERKATLVRGSTYRKGHPFAERKATLVRRGSTYRKGHPFAERKATLVRGSTHRKGHTFVERKATLVRGSPAPRHQLDGLGTPELDGSVVAA